MDDSNRERARRRFGSRWDFGRGREMSSRSGKHHGLRPFPAAASSSTSEARGGWCRALRCHAGYSYTILIQAAHSIPLTTTAPADRYLQCGHVIWELTAEVSGYGRHRDLNGTTVHGRWTNYLFGPRLNLRRDYFVPFGNSWWATPLRITNKWIAVAE